MPENPTRYLAFDFGLRRIGVAIGQSLTQTANPLPHLLAKEGCPDWSIIKKLLDKWRPDVLLVGIPLNMDGSEQAITQKARQFAKELQQQFVLPVEEVDERLSTIEARRKLFNEGGYRALKKGVVDSYAAVVLLEAYLRQ